MTSKAPRKVLITGGQGFIGKSLMNYYKSQGIDVVGVDLHGNGEDVHEGDISKPESITRLLDECDVIIHTAALVTNALKDSDMWRVNVLATRNLIEAAEAHGVRRFVHISSVVVYGYTNKGELDESFPVHAEGGSYVFTKLASEHTVLAAHAHGKIEVVVVRPGDVYGPGSRPWVVIPLEGLRGGKFVLPAKGKGYFRPIFVDDLIRGIALAAATDEAAGEIINLSCKGYVTTMEFFSHYTRWMDKPALKTVPKGLALFITHTAVAVSGVFGKTTELSPPSVKQLSTESWFSIDKAEKLLGWKPEVTIEDGMEKTKAWAQEQGLLN